MLLGNILVQEKIIDLPTLEEALKVQKKTTSSLGDILIGLGKVTPLDIARALSIQFDLPYRNMMEDLPDLQVLRQVEAVMGEEFFRNHSLLPLGMEGRCCR